MTNSHKNMINPFLESSTLLIMTFPEIVESKDLLWGRTCAVDNVRARRKGVLGKLYEIQLSPERGLRNSLKFPSYFGMEYVRPWNMGKKLLELSSIQGKHMKETSFKHSELAYSGSTPRHMTKINGNMNAIPAWQRTVRTNVDRYLKHTGKKRDGRLVYRLKSER